MTQHEVVIQLGRELDVQLREGPSGPKVFSANIREITLAFNDRESAEAAQRDITVHVRQVRDADGEDYHPVVASEVIEGP